jgi:hypothetical protein
VRRRRGSTNLQRFGLLAALVIARELFAGFQAWAYRCGTAGGIAGDDALTLGVVAHIVVQIAEVVLGPPCLEDVGDVRADDLQAHASGLEFVAAFSTVIPTRAADLTAVVTVEEMWNQLGERRTGPPPTSSEPFRF